MKRPLLIPPLLALAAVPCLAQDPATNAVAGTAEAFVRTALDEYRALESNVCARIATCFDSSGITNVYPVYAAGYIHSREAVPLLARLIDVKSVDEPAKYYHPSFEWEKEETEPRADKPFVVGRPSPLFPKPPTPAVAALTQTPIPFETLTNFISSADSDRRRQYFAWVAAAKYPERYFPWIAGLEDNAPDWWSDLREYTDSHLIGRKPFAVYIYKPSLILTIGADLWKFDQNADRLRAMVSAAAAKGDNETVAAISSCLREMGLPVSKPTLSEIVESVELVNEQ